ncbi:hypothetical protein CCACVL1_04050 [Corchorus capsularis]|uniref:Uncharacterized protein n=1 Tax=Corchorus capsularis TaxID=210143 RepID=A0A1R3JVM0_COCAP|nr:hypothetical protein CCACVL1_04050 [Corchorus capsularis]
MANSQEAETVHLSNGQDKTGMEYSILSMYARAEKRGTQTKPGRHMKDSV